MKTRLKDVLAFVKSNVTGMICFSVLALATACNKDFESVLPEVKANDTSRVSSGEKKVLYIIMDGVRGSVLATLKTPNITEINRNATYSFAALNDSTSNITPTNAGGWADMLTGVNGNSHKVKTEDFAGADFINFPSIFTRLKQVRPDLKTLSFASSASFDANLATDAGQHAVYSTDAETKSAAVSAIGDTNAGLVVAQFHSAEVAGANGGYSTANSNYTAAITTIDGYIGELLAKLKTRANIASENWLVIVASNKGGADSGAPTNDVSLFGKPEKNTYVAIYNIAFAPKAYNKPNTTEIPYAGSAPRFVGTTTTTDTAILSNSNIGNFGTTGNYVIMFKIRNDASANSSWPMFLRKSNSKGSTLSTNGWAYAFAGTSFQNDFGNIVENRPNVSDIRDSKWHTIASRLSIINGIRTVTQFSDGVKRGTYTKDVASKNFTNQAFLKIGIDPGFATNFLIRDLAIYEADMSDADILQYMKREVTVNNPYFANLIGWWPCNEGAGLELKDRSGKGNNFILSNKTTWASFSDLSPNISPEVAGVAYRTVPNNVDLPFQIYNWLGVLPASDWSLTGRTWSPSYLNLTTN